MSIDEHLMRDETILAAAVDGIVTFYATNRRVIRHEKGPFKEDVDSLPFSAITAVSFEEETYGWASVLGIAIIAVFWDVGRSYRTYIILFGILLIIAGLQKRNRYQIKGTGMSDSDRKRWRLENTKSPDVKAFARMLEDRVMKG